MSRLFALWIPPVLAATVLAQAAPSKKPAKAPIQGITISTHGIGRDWGTDRITPCIKEIRGVGANWISIHPYATIHASGRVTWRPFDPKNPPAHLVRPIKEAHALGMKVFIKPHLAYWGSPFKWRGEIAFEKDSDWQRFFDSYSKWIVAVAAACKDADGFCVGTELDKTIAKDKKWRALISAVRKVTKAPLTYAANWTDYTAIGFWDALDIIGIQAYFPLTDKKNAKVAELRAGWQTTMATLRKFAAKKSRNIVFTELGYNTSFEAAIRPWDPRSDGPRAAAFQRTCMSIALAAIAAEPRVEGAFLWKWFPPPSAVGLDFPLATPEMKRTLRAAWLKPVESTGKKPTKTGKQ
jgi:hypothetical protein